MGSLTFSTKDIPDLSGKTFIITGGNSGIGYETAKNLALKGGHVIIATHAQKPDAPMPTDEVDGPGAVEKIKKHDSNAKVEYRECDCSSFRSIRSFAESILSSNMPVHCLINNSGLQTPPNGRTEDDFEITMGINFFSHFYLTQLLLPALKRSTPSRIVWTSSNAETAGYTDWNDIRCDNRKTVFETYGTSKLWMLLMALEFNDRLKGTGVESFACQPGIARTDAFRKGDHEKTTSVVTDWAQFFTGQSAASGALSMMYCATSPDLEGKGGTYYGPPYKSTFTANVMNTSRCNPKNDEAQDPEIRHKLYDAVLQIVNETAARLGQDGAKKAGPTAGSAAATDVAQAAMAAEGEEAGGINKAAAGVVRAAADAPAGTVH
jgi:NAD(P)-dependent dehydrogenase (short-subunit alcohol dehydrogenase family)